RSRRQHPEEVLHALDNLCPADGSMVVGNGFFIHLGRFYPHPAAIGYRNSTDSHNPGTKSTVARALKTHFLREVCMLKNLTRVGMWALVVVFALTSPVMAQQFNKQSVEADRAADAVNVLNEIMNIAENSIPEELMARAHGIAVIPHVVKGAFGIGG